jgi:hypothetical protein
MADHNQTYSFCPTAECAVSTCQTEGQCRDQHHCGPGPCPLAGEFHDGFVAERVPELTVGAWSWMFTPGRSKG